jgi:hypothetical protein
MSATSVLARVIPGSAIIVSATAAFAQQTEQLTLPRVTVSVPAIPVSPPYLRDPGTAYQRNPYTGRYLLILLVSRARETKRISVRVRHQTSRPRSGPAAGDILLQARNLNA